MKKTKSEWWSIDKLKAWSKNPRGIKVDRYQELKRRLQDQGIIKPLLITEDGTVIGGNMRLRAMQELGWTEVWVSITDAKTDKEIFELALTDNEEFGYYEKDAIAELAWTLELDENDLNRFQLNLGKPQTLADITEKLNSVPDDKPEVEFTQELMEKHNYVVLYFDNEVDWLQLNTLYPLPTVAALDSKTGFEKHGVGRVVNGADFLNKILDHES